MTASELIQLLKEYPPDMEVFIDGYEGGYGDVTCVETLKITTERVNNEWYYGSHEQDDNGKEVVYIPR